MHLCSHPLSLCLGLYFIGGGFRFFPCVFAVLLWIIFKPPLLYSECSIARGVSPFLWGLIVRRVKLRGFSGVVHDVDVVEYGGRRFILIKVDNNVSCDLLPEYLVKILVCYDVGLPPLVIAVPPSGLPESAKRAVGELNGVILEVNAMN